ncbi:hypothetical protein HJB80_19740 [Rhizobium lentis]|uniref:hypothetical protein n=1 Tax=Rhizobium lentis TaxID=1138194 RepID=UPI001C83822E|nr:hypothetical protein [Rhizobium lentis]MBX5134863.1 hypothetical protein [Rhizobium lentis]MBX5153804.1 hypothetical protein [Rhizobium lentis]MBX5174960.1 hypothetical protein [Rhizobium lentis]
MEPHVFAKQNHREENQFAGCEKRRRGPRESAAAIKSAGLLALMAATVSLPRTGAMRGELAQAEKKASEK